MIYGCTMCCAAVRADVPGFAGLPVTVRACAGRARAAALACALRVRDRARGAAGGSEWRVWLHAVPGGVPPAACPPRPARTPSSVLWRPCLWLCWAVPVTTRSRPRLHCTVTGLPPCPDLMAPLRPAADGPRAALACPAGPGPPPCRGAPALAAWPVPGCACCCAWVWPGLGWDGLGWRGTYATGRQRLATATRPRHCRTAVHCHLGWPGPGGGQARVGADDCWQPVEWRARITSTVRCAALRYAGLARGALPAAPILTLSALRCLSGVRRPTVGPPPPPSVGRRLVALSHDHGTRIGRLL